MKKTNKDQRDAIDLSTVNVFALFRKYFIPTLLGMVSISAVTVVDGIFVGHGVGSDGIAAINICCPALMLLTGIGLMIGAGSSVVAALHLSQNKEKAARINVTQAMALATIAALIPTLIVLIFPTQVSLWLGSSQNLLPMVKDYLIWFAPAWIFQLWTAIGLFAIRLDGKPKLAMFCSLVSALLNVVLDWLFIFPFGWGVMGAAFATAISVAAGGIIAMVYLLSYARHLRLYPVKLSRKSLRLTLRNLGYQCRIGSSALLGEATLAVLIFVGNYVFMKYLGDDGVGAFGIACYYIPFVFMVGNAIAQSAQPIISYNYGARNKQRVSSAYKLLLKASLTYSVLLWLFVMIFPQGFAMMFTSDTELLNFTKNALRIYMGSMFLFGIQMACQMTFTALGKAVDSIIVAVMRKFVLLLPLIYIMPNIVTADKTNAVYMAEPIADFLAVSFTAVLFIFEFKKALRSISAESQKA